MCGFPPEYCEFGARATRCAAWLADAHPAEHERFYGADALAAKGADAREASLAKSVAKAEARADARDEAERARREAARVAIRRVV